MEFFIGQLVESWSSGFGTVVRILDTGTLVIVFPYILYENKERWCTKENALKWFLFYNRDRTAYLNPENDWRDK